MTRDGTEAMHEADALEWIGDWWVPVTGEAIAPGSGERETWEDLAIPGRLLDALRKLNPGVPNEQLVQAREEILTPTSADAITENMRAHAWLTAGYRLDYVDDDGVEQSPTLRVISAEPADNDYLVANQVTIRRPEGLRRFDLVLYCNGLPVAIVELKRAGSEQAHLAAAHAQLQTYLREFPLAFRFCVLTVISDGILARYGTPFTPLNHYAPWYVDDDGTPYPPDAEGVDGEALSQLEALCAGLLQTDRFGQLARNYVSFSVTDGGIAKLVAKPHQYFAVARAIAATIIAYRTDGKAGVVWHTQGAGKSLEMEFYTHLVQRHPLLENPTVVVITDRKELDGQLFGAFERSGLLAESPLAVKTRTQLRAELTGRRTGGILFTTLQKFGLTQTERDTGASHPLLSDRRNIIVVVDEAHRSHYDDLDGYARHLRDALPHATLIAFTGTPISLPERDTRNVFGPDIDVYDLSRAVADGATVPVVFEPRLVQVALADGVTQDDFDDAADRITEGLDDVERAQLERSVAKINAIYGAPARIATLADDILEHWDARSTAMLPQIEVPGKALIVCATREICARLYAALVQRRPEWHSDSIEAGVIKVVYSGSASDQPPVSDHVRTESQNSTIKERLRNPDDELQLVIVKDMMLTGYDSPPLHTLYLDRPQQGAQLMQTLARVNRTFRGKDAGLLVGYAPLVENLQAALAVYSKADQEGRPMGRPHEEAVALVQQLAGELDQLTAPFGWQQRLSKGVKYVKVALGLVNWLREQRPGDDEAEPTASTYRRKASQLQRAWALASGDEALAPLRGTVRFYEEVRVYMAKFDAEERRASGRPVPEEIARLLGDLIARSTSSGEVLDLYEAAGLPKPELDALTPEVLAAARTASNAQLALEALRNAVLSEASRVTGGNIVRHRAFSERVAELMARYANSQLTAAQVIEALIELAQEVAAEARRGERFTPPLGTDELALYDAVAENRSAVEVMGDDVLGQIARDLVAIMQRDVKTDWTVRDDVRAKLRSSIKRLLVKHNYPPDKQPGAVKLVLEQMELLAPRFAAR
ncbi:type I restriction endonuclease subunit R [Propioniciclava sp. MC1595]|uniref:type I restriction endonuclease subunit R n=1 Tax=Propioniciclava sp. MC1595 TaxID=2760308 RepID=UPI001662707E|nr:type I restriction endonuclease subunit R [Propioniciclava sp. MC1595]MBB1494937.1 type I restriction endonuclease subunit R [Propioniciclava sp. MC1595]QTE25557.1 type I restriction endonuclease subunit R [Propioniciclava sp. MC1595]